MRYEEEEDLRYEEEEDFLVSYLFLESRIEMYI